MQLTVQSSEQQGDAVRLVATTRVDRHAFGITASRGMTGRYLDLTVRLSARPVV